MNVKVLTGRPGPIARATRPTLAWVALALQACGTGGLFPAYPSGPAEAYAVPGGGEPLDVSDVVRRYPELAGVIMSAPEHNEALRREQAGRPRDSGGGRVTVMGAGRVTTVPIREGATLTQALAGIPASDGTDWRQVRVVRRADPGRGRERGLVVVSDLAAFAAGDLLQDVALEDGDAVVLPQGRPSGVAPDGAWWTWLEGTLRKPLEFDSLLRQYRGRF